MIDDWHDNKIDEILKTPEIQNCINFCRAPRKEDIFKALELVSPKDVKCLIIGQDPYPQLDANGFPLNAHGLAFSSLAHKTPYSLARIFEAINTDLGLDLKLNTGKNNLTSWAENGVLLLNMALTHNTPETVGEHIAAWRPFIHHIIEILIDYKVKNNEKLVLMLWGSNAQAVVTADLAKKFNDNILVIKALHPAYQGGKDLKNQHCFKKCQEFLSDSDVREIFYIK